MHRNNSPLERLRRFEIDLDLPLDADRDKDDFFVTGIGGKIATGGATAMDVDGGGEENSGVGTPVLAGRIVVGAGSGGRLSGTATEVV